MRTPSVVNMMYDESRPAAPTVGMGATVLMWTDRHAATVVAVGPNGRWLDVQLDNATRTDTHGASDSQHYSYTPNADAPITRYTLRRDGKYKRAGESMRGGLALLLGKRDHHFDYSF